MNNEMNTAVWTAEEHKEPIGIKEKVMQYVDKAKAAVEVALDRIRKIRRVCCFTSLFALLGVLFFWADKLTMPHFADIAIVTLWFAGVVSAFIACPLKIIGKVVAFVSSGVLIGLPFMVVGAVVGLIIGLAISLGMVMIFPALVTIPYYFNELNFKGRRVE